MSTRIQLYGPDVTSVVVEPNPHCPDKLWSLTIQERDVADLVMHPDIWQRVADALAALGCVGQVEPPAFTASTYECAQCGAALGIAGEGGGSESDHDADAYFDAEVERHESGACVAAAVTA